MKKGDLKKQEILATAEEMFCRNGYAATGVQDIIDRLDTSKGSFYHHFASKEAVLEGICANRATVIYSAAEKEAERAFGNIDRLNILLSGMIPFREEKLPFLLMLLPVFTEPEGRMVRDCYSDTLVSLFHGSVCRQIKEGNESGDLSCDDPENAADLILSLVSGMWIRIADLIIEAENRRTEPDLSECLRLADACRTCIERFLFLPFGSIVLTDIPSLRLTIRQIHTHWALKT
ncbi:MAG: TetR/AcrR family transcriptional regulator [Clostridiales bacterium]|nr:TetR/AcrR family transcriptional regulator [Clostridiales bacterium]